MHGLRPAREIVAHLLVGFGPGPPLALGGLLLALAIDVGDRGIVEPRAGPVEHDPALGQIVPHLVLAQAVLAGDKFECHARLAREVFDRRRWHPRAAGLFLPEDHPKFRQPLGPPGPLLGQVFHALPVGPVNVGRGVEVRAGLALPLGHQVLVEFLDVGLAVWAPESVLRANHRRADLLVPQQDRGCREPASALRQRGLDLCPIAPHLVRSARGRGAAVEFHPVEVLLLQPPVGRCDESVDRHHELVGVRAELHRADQPGQVGEGPTEPRA